MDYYNLACEVFLIAEKLGVSLSLDTGHSVSDLESPVISGCDVAELLEEGGG